MNILARLLDLLHPHSEPIAQTTDRQRDLDQLERLKQAQIEEGKRRLEWIEHEKAIILREHTK